MVFPKKWNTKILISSASQCHHEEEAATVEVFCRGWGSFMNLVFSREACVSFKSVIPEADQM